jgi:HEPN domain-containing protein
MAPSGILVCESQEIVELALKRALRFIGVDPPKRHDVLATLRRSVHRLPDERHAAMGELDRAPAELAEERAQAFYGDEGELIPASELYGEEDAKRAVQLVDRWLGMYERLLVGQGTPPEG